MHCLRQTNQQIKHLSLEQPVAPNNMGSVYNNLRSMAITITYLSAITITSLVQKLRAQISNIGPWITSSLKGLVIAKKRNTSQKKIFRARPGEGLRLIATSLVLLTTLFSAQAADVIKIGKYLRYALLHLKFYYIQRLILKFGLMHGVQKVCFVQ